MISPGWRAPSLCRKRFYALAGCAVETKGRARIEQGIGKIKRFKRVALRCEKTAHNFAAFISLACTFILVKSVHTA